MLETTKRKQFLFFILCSSILLLAGCGGKNDHDNVAFKNDEGPTCPLPQSLPKEDIDKTKKFGLEVSGIASSLAGGKLNAELDSKINRDYPASDDVNRIYALTYAACVSCRLNPGNMHACSSNFDKLIDKYTGSRPESTAADRAEKYRKRIFKQLK